MSVIIQIIVVGHLCTVICFRSRLNFGDTLSVRAYRRHAQDSEVMVVSLLKCQSFIEIVIVEYFCSVIIMWVIFVVSFVFEIGQIMGLPSPSELTGGAPKILRLSLIHI